MKYKIVTDHELSEELLRKQLQAIISLFKKNKINSIIIQFGFAWASEFNNWNNMELKINDVIPMVCFVEDRSYGKLGCDDLTFKKQIDQFWIEIVFCHHAGIECSFIGKNNIIKKIYNLWKMEKLNPQIFEEPLKKYPKWKKITLKEIK